MVPILPQLSPLDCCEWIILKIKSGNLSPKYNSTSSVTVVVAMS